MFTQTNNCGSTVLPNGTCTFNVTFTPTNTIFDTSTLTINDNADSGLQAVALSGFGAQPRVSFTPDLLTFGSVAVNSSSALTDTVTNIGSVALTITKIALTGSNTKYYKESDNCPRSPKTLAAGATCVATITFTPTITGALDSTLTITDNVSTGSSTMNLNGTGKYPMLSFTPKCLIVCRRGGELEQHFDRYGNEHGLGAIDRQQSCSYRQQYEILQEIGQLSAQSQHSSRRSHLRCDHHFYSYCHRCAGFHAHHH
jgi:hypothetical protein